MRLGHLRVTLVDTPGFDDTYIQIFSRACSMAHGTVSEAAAHDSYLAHAATRMAGGIVRNLTVMKKMLGVQSFPSLTLVTSMQG